PPTLRTSNSARLPKANRSQSLGFNALVESRGTYLGPKKSPAPLFHAFTHRVRRELNEAYPRREVPAGKLSSCPTLRQRLGSSRSPWIEARRSRPPKSDCSLTTQLQAVAEPRSPRPNRAPERDSALFHGARHGSIAPTRPSFCLWCASPIRRAGPKYSALTSSFLPTRVVDSGGTSSGGRLSSPSAWTDLFRSGTDLACSSARTSSRTLFMASWERDAM